MGLGPGFVTVEEAVFEADDTGAALDHALVMGDEDEGLALAIEVVEEVEDFFAGFGVEVASGFVGEDDERAVGESAGDGNALLLAAGELVGSVIEAVVESDLGGKFCGDFPHFFIGGPAVIHGDGDVFSDGELLDEVVGLKDEAEVAIAGSGEVVVVEGGDVLAAEEVVARSGLIQAAEDVEEGGLAAAGGAHDADIFASIDVEADATQDVGLDIACDVGFPDVGEPDDRRWGALCHGKGDPDAAGLPAERRRGLVEGDAFFEFRFGFSGIGCWSGGGGWRSASGAGGSALG